MEQRPVVIVAGESRLARWTAPRNQVGGDDAEKDDDDAGAGILLCVRPVAGPMHAEICMQPFYAPSSGRCP